MIRKIAGWIRRGICLGMAAAVLCSDVSGFAAQPGRDMAMETEYEDNVPSEEAGPAGAGETGEENAEPVLPTETEEAGLFPDREDSGEENTEDKTQGDDEPGENGPMTADDGEVPAAGVDMDTLSTEENTEISTSPEEEGTETETVPAEGSTETETVPAEGNPETEAGSSDESTETEKQTGPAKENPETETAATEEKKVKRAAASDVIRLDTVCELMEIGQTIPLPGYTITDASLGNPAVKWTVENPEIVSVDAAGRTVTALKAGVAFLKLQLAADAAVSAVFQAVVRPEAPSQAAVARAPYNLIQLEWGSVSGADGYVIYRKTDKESSYTQLAVVSGQGTVAYADKAVLTGKTYAYQICAYVGYKDGNGTARYAESTGKAVIKGSPELGGVTIGKAVPKSAVSVEITWEPLDGAQGYVIYRATGSSSDFVQAGHAEGKARSFTDKGLTSGQSYRYKVAGYRVVENARVYGAESDEVSVKPMPQAPELAVSVPDYKTVRLDWKKAEGANGYEIERKVSGNSTFKKIKTIKSGSTVKWTDKSVQTGLKYVYRIRAYRTVGGSKVWGNYSAEKSVTPTLAAPSVELHGDTYTSLVVSWNKVSGAQGYRVYRAESRNGKYKSVKNAKGSGTLRFTDTKLKVGRTYYYKVCAYRTVDGEMINGVRSEAVAYEVRPAAPELKWESAGTTAVRLTWKKVGLPSKNSGYYVYQVVNGKEKKLKTCKATTTSYTVKNLTCGQKYTFKIAAYVKNSDGRVVRGLDSKTLTVSPKPLAVEITLVEPSANNRMRITWNATSDAGEDSYLIYRSTSKKSGFKKIGTVSRRAGVVEYSYEDRGVSIGKRYYYKIRCEKKIAGGKSVTSDFSKVKSAVAAPAAPVVTLKKGKNNSVKIVWKKVKGTTSGGYVNGYVIYRSTTKDGKYATLKKISSGTTTSYTDKNLKIGETYYYKMRAYCKVNNKEIYGPYSDVCSQKIVPGTPVITVKAVDYTTIGISWNKIEGSDGYQVYKSAAEDGTFKKVATVSANRLSYNDKKAVLGTAGYYKVRAYSTRGGKKIYGSFSSVKGAVPILNKPTNVKAEMAGDRQVRLTWNAVAGAETYTILRSTSESGTYKIASEICNTNSFTDNNVVAGKIYFYKVYAVRGDVKSEMSDSVAAIASSLSVSVTDVLIRTGSNVKVSATANPASVIAWTSDNPSVAVVTSEGVIYGMKAGTTKVNATANGIKKSINVTVKDQLDRKGIDISSNNGTVDFNAIKASGYEYVMLRVCDGTTADPNFETNYKNAKTAGLKVGVYCYARARNVNEARAEATKMLQLLNGHAIDYPVVYDMQEETLLYGLDNKIRNDNLDAFKNVMINAGRQYRFALRTTQRWLTGYLDNSRLTGYNLWVVNHRDVSLGHGYTGKGSVIMWQYTDKGTVSGVNGNVAISVSYTAY